jgi:hypothetical protein
VTVVQSGAKFGFKKNLPTRYIIYIQNFGDGVAR